MASGSNFAYEYNSGAGVLAGVAGDLLVVSGDVSIAGAHLNLSDLAGTQTAYASGTVLTLINYTGTLSSGFFDLAENATVTVGSNTWKINYGAASGGINFAGDFVGSKFINLSSIGALTAVPEPGSLLALGCLVGSGAFLRNRRRSK